MANELQHLKHGKRFTGVYSETSNSPPPLPQTDDTDEDPKLLT